MGGTYGGQQSNVMERGGHSGKGPKGYRRNDERIKEDISERLKLHDDIDASEITVDVREGIATLTGEVDSRDAKRAAEDCVECISGVNDVTNQLQVRSKRGESGQGNRSHGSQAKSETQNSSSKTDTYANQSKSGAKSGTI